METKHLRLPVQKIKLRAVGIVGRLTGMAALYHHSIYPTVNYPKRVVPFRVCLN